MKKSCCETSIPAYQFAIRAFGIMVALVTATATFPATAGIIGISGSVAVVPIPSSLVIGAFTSDVANIMVERINTSLSQTLTLDITQPGSYSDGGEANPMPAILSPGALPAATRVDSYIVHYERSPDFGVASGSITFDTPILGIITGNNSGGPGLLDLVNSDAIVGNPGTTYEPSSDRDMFDNVGLPDTVTLSSDFRTVTFQMSIGGALDEFRVITVSSVPDPITEIAEFVPCAGPISGGAWKNHGQYVSAVVKIATAFLANGLITQEEKDSVVNAAATSLCGK